MPQVKVCSIFSPFRTRKLVFVGRICSLATAPRFLLPVSLTLHDKPRRSFDYLHICHLKMTLNSEPKLTLVFNEVSPDSHAVDIVAVPGLGGIASWKPSTASSGHGQTDFWLCDWLPDDLPVSSIYVYEYPWAVFGGRSGIFKVAESLLDALKAARSKQKVSPPSSAFLSSPTILLTTLVAKVIHIYLS